MNRVANAPNSSGAPSAWDLIKRYGPTAIIVLAAGLFVVQNTQSTQFTFLWFDFSLPLWLMLVVFAAIGALVGFLVARRRGKRSSST